MPTYSHSRLKTFEDCPQKYKFRYIDKIEKPDELSVEAFVGRRVHETLQKLYDDLALGKVNSLDDLHAHYRDQWEKNWGPGIKIVKRNRTAEEYLEYGAQCIRNYYEQYHPFDQSQTITTEAHFVFPLEEAPGYKIQGYIDRIARRPDGTWEIHEYKTSRRLPTQEGADSDRQLGFYQIGLASQRDEAKQVELIWHYVGLETTLRTGRTPEQLAQLKAQTVDLIRDIEQETEFKPVKSRLCDWCEYKPDCPLWKS